MRVKLGGDREAPQPDPLGRIRIGYRPGADPFEVWERGRGVWTAHLDIVAKSDLLVLVHEGVVVGVGSIAGVAFHGLKIAIIGRPDPHHALLGAPDPVANRSHNPVAYGTVALNSVDGQA